MTAILAVAVGFGSLGVEQASANPSKVWVINENVAKAVNGGVAVDVTTVAGRTAAAATKTTIQEAATTCVLSDSTSGPTKTAATGTYTDINGTALVGYTATWSPLFTASGAKAGVAASTATAMLQADGTTVASSNVICGVLAGTQ